MKKPNDYSLEVNIALLRAADAGDLDLLNELLNKGANPNISITDDGRTALHFSVSNKYFLISLALLKAGANPNVEYLGEIGDAQLMVSSLWIAINNADLLHVKILLEHGANIYSDARYNPLFLAALVKDQSIVHYQIYQLIIDQYFTILEKYHQEYQSNKRDFEVVIVRYDEDPRFLAKWISLEFPHDRVIIYNKGEDDLILPANCEEIKIPNLGWFGGTILYHIYHQYEYLAERTLFLQADPYPQSLFLPLVRYKENLASTCNTIIAKCTLSSLAEQHADFASHIGEAFPVGKYQNFPPLNETIIEYTHKYYGKYPLETPLAINLGAQFAVDRAIIYNHPKEYYAAPAAQLHRNKFASEDFYQEKLIDLMFQPDLI